MKIFKITQAVLIFLIILIFSGGVTLEYFLLNKYEISQNDVTSDISILEQSNLTDSQLNKVITRLNIAKPALIICFDCSENIYSNRSFLKFNTDSIFKYYTKSNTEFDVHKFVEVFEIVDYDNTRYNFDQYAKVNSCKELDQFYKINIQTDFEKLSYKVSTGIILIFGNSNSSSLNEKTTLANTINTLIFDNYYDMSGILPTIILVLFLTVIRLFLIFQTKRFNNSIIPELIFLFILIGIFYLLISVNILIDFILILMIFILLISSDQLVKKFIKE
ncbi:MAG: hypothetical protein ACJASR_002187 [Psychroserpens sp.]|jgi:hypothetical protein